MSAFDNPSAPRPGEEVLLIGGPKHGWVWDWPEPWYGPKPDLPHGDYEVIAQEANGRWVAIWRGAGGTDSDDWRELDDGRGA